MSASKEAYWDEHPCAACGEAPALLEGDLCEACDEER
jgi:hypothetical protein